MPSYLTRFAAVVATSLGFATAAAADLPVNVDFAPTSVAPLQESRLTFTLFNQASFDAVSAALIAPLETGIRPSATPNLVSDCSAAADTTLNTTTTPPQIELSNGTIPAASGGALGSCTISLNVFVDGGGSYDQEIAANALTAMVNGTGDTNAARGINTLVATVSEIIPRLNVVQPATTTGSLIRGGETPELLIRLENTNVVPVTGVAFPIDLTSGQALEMRAAPGAVATLSNCGPASSTNVAITTGAAAANYPEPSLIDVTGVEIPAGQTCEIRVPVTHGRPITLNGRLSGNKSGSIPAGAVTSDQNATNNATTYAFNTTVGLSSTMEYVPGSLSIANGPASAILRYEFINPNSVPITDFTFDEVLPAGLTITSVDANTCGSGPSTTATTSNNPGPNVSSTFQVTGGDLAANDAGPFTSGGTNGTCIIEVEVTPQRAGTFRDSVGVAPGLQTTAADFQIFDFQASLSVTERPIRIDAILFETSTGIASGPTVFLGDDFNIVIDLINDSTASTVTNLNLDFDFGALAGRAEVYRDNAVPVVGPNCGAGTITAVDAATTFLLEDAVIAPGTTCRIKVPAVMRANGTLTFSGPTIEPGDISYTLGNDPTVIAGENRVSGFLFTGSPFQTTKAFLQNNIAPGEVSSLRFSLGYSQTRGLGRKDMGLTDVTFTDVLPMGHEVSSTPNLTNTCGGNVIAPAGSTQIEVLTANTLLPGENCTVQVDIVAPALTPGQLSESAENLVSGASITSRDVGQAGAEAVFTGGDMRATLTRRAPPVGLSTSFSPVAINGGGITRARITIANINGQSIPLTGVSVANSLPSGFMIAIGNNPTFTDVNGVPNANGCTGGTFTGADGTQTFAMSDASIARNTTCFVEFDVQGFVGGSQANTIPALAVGSDQGVTNLSSANATLTVNQTMGVAKAFSPDFLNVGETSTLTITIVNTSASSGGTADETGTATTLVDELPAGLTVTGTVTNTCGGTSTFNNPTSGRSTVTLSGGSFPEDSSCTITAPVTASASDTYTNQIVPDSLNLVSANSNRDTAIAEVEFFTAAITAVKTATPAVVSEAGDTVSYAIEVRNAGDVTLTDVGIQSDTLTRQDAANTVLTLAAPTLPGGATTTTLDPGETATFTTSYELDQLDVDAGGISNTATAVGTTPADTPVTDVSGTTAALDDSTDTTIAPDPQIALLKSASLDITANGDAVLNDGDEIDYSYTVSNEGNVTLRNVTVTEPQTLANPFTGTGTKPTPSDEALPTASTGSSDATAGDLVIDSLAPGETATFAATYEVTQDDITAGSVTNSALASGTPPTGNAVTDTSGSAIDNDTQTVTDLDEAPSIRLVKSAVLDLDTAGTAGFPDPGDTITYTYVVSNTGNVPLTNVMVTEPNTASNLFSGTGDLPEPGEEELDAADMVSVNTDDNDGVINTLAVGASATFTAVYEITGDDIIALTVTNSALAAGVSPDDVTVNDTSGETVNDDDATETDLGEAPAISVVKTGLLDLTVAGSETALNPGDVITYSYVVTNEGNVALSNVTVLEPNDVDNPFSGTGTTPEPTDATLDAAGNSVDATANDAFIDTLAVGESATLTADYALTQADINAGVVTNSALGEGISPEDVTVRDTSGSTETNDTATSTDLNAVSDISLVKTADPSVTAGADDTVTDLGDTITYTLVATNDGETTLTAVSITSETLSLGLNGGGTAIDLTGEVRFVENSGASAEGTLAPGETATYTLDFLIDEAASDAGGVSNIATVSASPPVGDDIDGNTDAPVITSINDTGFNDVIEDVLEEDLLQTVSILSQNVSLLSARAADRLRVTRGEQCGLEINQLLKTTPIRFASDKFFIDARNTVVLDEIALLLSQCATSDFMIEGHTDSDASDAYNITLSSNRVNAVRAALEQRGIAKGRLQTRGFGESRPIATNATEEGQALNRRVEFILLDGPSNDQPQCGDGNTASGNLSGSANDQGGSFNGRVNADGYNCATGEYTETWGNVNVVSEEDRGVTGMLNFGISKERQFDNRLRGRFVEGYISQSNVDRVDATGTITGVGVHAGLFGARGYENGLLLSYYGSAAVGNHGFDLDVGIDVDGNYTYAAVLGGVAIAGETSAGELTLKPRSGVDLAYAESIGSEVSTTGSLDIEPATFARTYVELAFASDAANPLQSAWEIAPRVFCETSSGETEGSCGYGSSVTYVSALSAQGSQWDIDGSYAVLDDQKTASVSLGRSQPILNNLGVSRSNVGASMSGALSLEQVFEFTW